MKHLSPKEAHEFLLSHPDALFIDCRSDAEYFLVGHAIIKRADHSETRPELICWSDEIRMEENPNFVGEVTAVCKNKSTPIVIICRSGRRSVIAGQALEAVGYGDVINVLNGFEGQIDAQDQRGNQNGWRFDGLPWEQL